MREVIPLTTDQSSLKYVNLAGVILTEPVNSRTGITVRNFEMGVVCLWREVVVLYFILLLFLILT